MNKKDKRSTVVNFYGLRIGSNYWVLTVMERIVQIIIERERNPREKPLQDPGDIRDRESAIWLNIYTYIYCDLLFDGWTSRAAGWSSGVELAL